MRDSAGMVLRVPAWLTFEQILSKLSMSVRRLIRRRRIWKACSRIASPHPPRAARVVALYMFQGSRAKLVGVLPGDGNPMVADPEALPPDGPHDPGSKKSDDL